VLRVALIRGVEQELKRGQIDFRKSDNAFDDVAALQAAADKLSAEIIRKRLDYWTLILGPKFSPKERKQINLSRFYAIAQIEYCRNFIFKRHFPIYKLFERSCELGLWRLTADRITEIGNFGVSDRRFRFKPAGGFGGNRQAVSVQSGTPLRMGFGPGFGEPPLRDTSYLALVCQSKYSCHYL
jgi:hypothetical protein